MKGCVFAVIMKDPDPRRGGQAARGRQHDQHGPPGIHSAASMRRVPRNPPPGCLPAPREVQARRRARRAAPAYGGEGEHVPWYVIPCEKADLETLYASGDAGFDEAGAIDDLDLTNSTHVVDGEDAVERNLGAGFLHRFSAGAFRCSLAQLEIPGRKRPVSRARLDRSAGTVALFRHAQRRNRRRPSDFRTQYIRRYRRPVSPWCPPLEWSA